MKPKRWDVVRDGQFVAGPMQVKTWEMTRSEWLARAVHGTGRAGIRG
jgi:hypothetical protein